MTISDTAKLKSDYENQLYDAEQKAKKKQSELEKENKRLHRVIEILQKTVDKVFGWISDTFSSKDRKELKSDFEYDTGRLLDPDKQQEKEDKQEEYEMGM